MKVEKYRQLSLASWVEVPDREVEVEGIEEAARWVFHEEGQGPLFDEVLSDLMQYGEFHGDGHSYYLSDYA